MNKFLYRNSSVLGKISATKRCINRTTRLIGTTTSPSSSIFDMKKEKEEFINTLPRILDNLGKQEIFNQMPEANDWMRKVLNGNLTGGKNVRGLSTVMTYKFLEDPNNITEESMTLARTLGWCVEIFQAYCVIIDDIADGAATRRGQPCWYRREDVGLAHATNDAILVFSALHRILRDNFENHANYVKLFHCIHEMLLLSSLGQHLDIKTGQNKKNYSLFTINRYNDIITYKTSYYTYKLPISLGMLFANKFNDENNKNVEEISLLLGRLFQMQDDYIDCFGDETIIGKIGSDIQEGKCSWLAVNALKHMKRNQRIVFDACYGSKEPAHVDRIKQLYVQLQLPQIYEKEELEIYENILKRIETIPSDGQRELFRKVLDITYGRKC